MSISEGSGTFVSCSFDGNTASVRTHGYVGLEIERCKFVGCICIVLDLCSNHKMHFMIFILFCCT